MSKSIKEVYPIGEAFIDGAGIIQELTGLDTEHMESLLLSHGYVALKTGVNSALLLGDDKALHIELPIKFDNMGKYFDQRNWLSTDRPGYQYISPANVGIGFNTEVNI